MLEKKVLGLALVTQGGLAGMAVRLGLIEEARAALDYRKSPESDIVSGGKDDILG